MAKKPMTDEELIAILQWYQRKGLEDYEFAATAKRDVPMLVAEIRKLQTRIISLQKPCYCCSEGCQPGCRCSPPCSPPEEDLDD